MSNFPSPNDREFDLLKKLVNNTAEIVAGGGGGGSYQPLSANLTSWAAITRVAGFDTFAATGTLLAAAGTIAAPSISFLSDTDTGFYRGSSGQVGYSSNGVQSLWFAAGGRIYGVGVEGFIEMPTGGAVSLTAAGVNQNITLTPSGTGSVLNQFATMRVTVSETVTANGYIHILPTATSKTGANFVLQSDGSVTLLNSPNAASALRFALGGNEKARIAPTTGNLLLGGLSTDGTGVLQFPAATTSAGGIAFGTDVNIFRTGSGAFAVSNPAGGVLLAWQTAGVQKGAIQTDSSNFYFDAPGSILLRTNGTTTALTLDSSQNAAFAGLIRSAAGTAAAPSISFASDTDTGFWRAGNGEAGFASNGVRSLVFSGGGRLYGALAANQYLDMPDTGAISLLAAGANQNITLTPSGTGTVNVPSGGIRITTNALPIFFRSSGADYVGMRLSGASTGNISFDAGTVYPTQYIFATTGATSGALILTSGGNTLLGGLTTNGTGVLQFPAATTSAGGIAFGTDAFLFRLASQHIRVGGVSGANVFSVADNTGNDMRMSFNTNASLTTGAGSLTLATNNAAGVVIIQSGSQVTALTISASQNATFAGQVIAGTLLQAGAANAIGWNGRVFMDSPSDGVMRISNNAQTDFNRLQFGGTTASFPALKRSSSELQSRLADDSGYANFAANRFIVTGLSQIISGSGAPSGSVSGPQGSLYLRTDGAGTTTRAYINTDGGTTWTAITTVA